MATPRVKSGVSLKSPYVIGRCGYTPQEPLPVPGDVERIESARIAREANKSWAMKNRAQKEANAAKRLKARPSVGENMKITMGIPGDEYGIVCDEHLVDFLFNPERPLRGRML